MLAAREILERRLKDEICAVCIESDGRGNCKLWDLEQCPISTHLERMVNIVGSMQSRHLEEYVARVRKEVCTECESAFSPLGKCAVREAGHCALDAYLMFLVQTIDDFLQQRDRAARC